MITDERERFEAWAKSRGNQMQMIDGEYACPITSDQWEAWQARCPDGWQVVPKEPTQYQQNAGSAERYHKQGNCEDIYKSMLSAAPRPGEDG